VLRIPAHLQADYDSLTDGQKAKFMQLAMWGAAGDPGNTIITDGAFDNILKSVKQMGDEPDTPAEPDRTVNHDWPFNPKVKV
jgi:hypothetical protein